MFAHDKHLTWLIADKCQGEMCFEPKMVQNGVMFFFLAQRKKKNKKTKKPFCGLFLEAERCLRASSVFVSTQSPRRVWETEIF